MTQIIGPVEPKLKARLDELSEWIEFYAYHSIYTQNRKELILMHIEAYQIVLDEAMI